MKHLRLFEEHRIKYKTNDYAKIISFTDMASVFKELDMSINDIVRIMFADNEDNTYLIVNTKNNKKNWVKGDNISKVEEWEIQQNKYNL